MYRPRPAAAPPALAATLLAVTLSMMLLAGCGGPGDHDAPVGSTVVHAGVAYTVQSSRELNPLTGPDRALLAGLSGSRVLDPPHKVLMGVFLQAQNVGSKPARAVAAPHLVSAEGQTFLPLALPAADPFAYRGGRLAPQAQLPAPDSAPAEGPQNGAVLVYRVPDNTFVTDRPFELRFGRGGSAASVQLDL